MKMKNGNERSFKLRQTRQVIFAGFPVIPLGVLRRKAMKKNLKKEKEGELWPPML
jgi:hypothetical protein